MWNSKRRACAITLINPEKSRIDKMLIKPCSAEPPICPGLSSAGLEDKQFDGTFEQSTAPAGTAAQSK